jgi:hypothetical protein
MKRNLLIIAMVLFLNQFLQAQQGIAKVDPSASATGQKISTFSNALFFKDTTYSKDYYLQKSKNQKTAAWVMLGGGVACSIVGIIGFSANYNLFEDNSATDTYGIVTLVGIGFALGSIPFFVSSSHNAKKAAMLSFKNQHILFPQQNSFVFKVQPTISLAIPL